MGLSEMGNGPGVEAECSGGWEQGLCMWEVSGHTAREPLTASAAGEDMTPRILPVRAVRPCAVLPAEFQ